MKNLKWAYIGGFILLTAFGAFYYQDVVKHTLNQKKQSSGSLSVEQVSSSAKVDTIERKYDVKGMYCSSCKEKIESKVKEIPGVIEVNVNQETNEMIVKYDKKSDTVKETMTVIKDLGYGIGLKSDQGKLQVVDFNIKFQ